VRGGCDDEEDRKFPAVNVKEEEDRKPSYPSDIKANPKIVLFWQTLMVSPSGRYQVWNRESKNKAKKKTKKKKMTMVTGR
jgi:hypothetical protein